MSKVGEAKLMIEDHFFLKNNVVEINAAVVGVSKTQWITITEQEASKDKAQEIMSRERFDVLPIKASNDSIIEYFCTTQWNDYNSIERKKIDYDDILWFSTSLRLVIKGLADEKRLFYFLSNQEEVIGLISVANLNCRQVRVFIFNLISELETQLSQLVQSKLSEEEILTLITKDKMEKRYLDDKNKGVESEIIEYLYFCDLINLIAKKHLYGELNYGSRKKFEKDFNPINELRNQAAHPTRSLITSPDSVKKLWDKIKMIERCLFQLRQIDF